MANEVFCVTVPRVTTERLVLRELRATDFDMYASSLADPAAMPFLTPVEDRRAAWRLFSALCGQWMLTGAGWWGIEMRATGEIVGTVGAFFRETSLGLGADADLELGWTVFPRFRRQGCATEAARAALASGFARHPVRRAIAHLDPANVASVGVCEAIGMSREGDVDFYGAQSARYAIARR